MNWRRGLFRLWVALSVAWIVVVAVSLNGNIRNVGAPITLHDGDQAIEFPNNIPRAVMKKALVDDYLKKRAAKSQPDPFAFFAAPAAPRSLQATSPATSGYGKEPVVHRVPWREELAENGPTYEVTFPDGAKYRVTAPEGANQQEVLKYVQEHRAELPRTNLTDDEKAEAIMADYQPRSLFRTLLSIGSFALLPPVALLAAGLAAAWVVRGFVRRPA
jgi:hypothetical protein